MKLNCPLLLLITKVQCVIVYLLLDLLVYIVKALHVQQFANWKFACGCTVDYCMVKLMRSPVW